MDSLIWIYPLHGRAKWENHAIAGCTSNIEAALSNALRLFFLFLKNMLEPNKLGAYYLHRIFPLCIAFSFLQVKIPVRNTSFPLCIWIKYIMETNFPCAL